MSLYIEPSTALYDFLRRLSLNMVVLRLGPKDLPVLRTYLQHPEVAIELCKDLAFLHMDEHVNTLGEILLVRYEDSETPAYMRISIRLLQDLLEQGAQTWWYPVQLYPPVIRLKAGNRWRA